MIEIPSKHDVTLFSASMGRVRTQPANLNLRHEGLLDFLARELFSRFLAYVEMYWNAARKKRN